MSKRHAFLTLTALLLLTVGGPTLAMAQTDTDEAGRAAAYRWVAIAAGFGMAFASGLCGLGQGRAVSAACEGMARNPGAAPAIRGVLIIGLILIESLAIYSLLIAFLLLNRFPAPS